MAAHHQLVFVVEAASAAEAARSAAPRLLGALRRRLGPDAVSWGLGHARHAAASSSSASSSSSCSAAGASLVACRVREFRDVSSRALQALDAELGELSRETGDGGSGGGGGGGGSGGGGGGGDGGGGGTGGGGDGGGGGGGGTGGGGDGGGGGTGGGGDGGGGGTGGGGDGGGGTGGGGDGGGGGRGGTGGGGGGGGDGGGGGTGGGGVNGGVGAVGRDVGDGVDGGAIEAAANAVGSASGDGVGGEACRVCGGGAARAGGNGRGCRVCFGSGDVAAGGVCGPARDRDEGRSGRGCVRGSDAAGDSAGKVPFGGIGPLRAALREALLGFPWDRPLIASPVKTAAKRRANGQRRDGGASAQGDDDDDEESGEVTNLLLLLAPCPQSREALAAFLGPGAEARTALGNLLATSGSIRLHWIDTTTLAEVLGSPDRDGAAMVAEALSPSGSLIPLEALLLLAGDGHHQDGAETELVPKLLPRKGAGGSAGKKMWRRWLTADATFPAPALLGHYLTKGGRPAKPAAAPLVPLVVRDAGGADRLCCSLSLVLATAASSPPSPVRLLLRGTVERPALGAGGLGVTRAWVACPHGEGSADAAAAGATMGDVASREEFSFPETMKTLASLDLLLVVEVLMTGCAVPALGLLYPATPTAALLCLIRCDRTLSPQHGHSQGQERQERQGDVPPIPPCQPDARGEESLLDCLERAGGGSQPDWRTFLSAATDPEPGLPDFFAGEAVGGGGGGGACVVEERYPELAGASGALAQACRSLAAVAAEAAGGVPARGDGGRSDPGSAELALMLGTLYSSACEEEGQGSFERGKVRTPVRQKLKTQNRALQMVNVARINVRSQRCRADADDAAAAVPPPGLPPPLWQEVGALQEGARF
ncbi:unnamed protein product [Lampetra planeri]